MPSSLCSPRRTLAAAVCCAILGAGAGTAIPHAGASGDYFVYLPEVSRAGSATVTPPGTPYRGTFFLPYTFGGNIVQSPRPQIAIDPANGIHVAYSSRSGDASIYGYCPSACTATDKITTLSINGAVFGVVYLALTPAGQPRLLLTEDVSGSPNYRYAECNANCTNGASWSISGRLGEGSYSSSDIEASHPFALDAQGRPRFSYSISLPNGTLETYLVSCDTDCLTSGNWSQVKVGDEYRDNLWLEIDPNGLPRLAYAAKVTDAQFNVTDRLHYLECASASCDMHAEPVELQIFQGRGVFSMKLDAAGHPRIAENPGWDRIFYAACDANCGSAGQWIYQDIGLPDTLNGHFLMQGELGVDLTLDAQGRPRIAYHSGFIGELGFAWCDANCTDGTQYWHYDVIGSRADSDAELGHIRLRCDNCVPRLPDCVSDWDVGYWPRLAVAANGDLRVVYESQLWTNGLEGACKTQAIARVSRLALFSLP
jgi:hypothetical protein